jgi:hypothetical protein
MQHQAQNIGDTEGFEGKQPETATAHPARTPSHQLLVFCEML